MRRRSPGARRWGEGCGRHGTPSRVAVCRQQSAYLRADSQGGHDWTLQVSKLGCSLITSWSKPDTEWCALGQREGGVWIRSAFSDMVSRLVAKRTRRVDSLGNCLYRRLIVQQVPGRPLQPASKAAALPDVARKTPGAVGIAIPNVDVNILGLQARSSRNSRDLRAGGCCRGSKLMVTQRGIHTSHLRTTFMPQSGVENSGLGAARQPHPS